jgi:hypothetical protein
MACRSTEGIETPSVAIYAYAHLRTGTFTVEIDEINYIESVL